MCGLCEFARTLAAAAAIHAHEGTSVEASDAATVALDNPDLTAAHGPFSEAFRARVKTALHMSPALVLHVASQLTTHAVGEGGGGGGGKKKPLPFNGEAHDGAHGLVALHGGWCEVFGLEAPEPSWRSPSGAIIGYGASVDPEGMYAYVAQATDALKAEVDRILEHADPQGVLAWEKDLRRRVFSLAANFPREDAAVYLPAPHSACGERIVKFPPDLERDEPFIVCSGCGATFTEASAARNELLAVEVAKVHRAAQVAADRIRKRQERKAAASA